MTAALPRDRWLGLWLLRLGITFIAFKEGQGSESTTVASSGNKTIDTPSPFLRHGDSYDGRLASKIQAESLASVAVLITIDNWSKWALVEPEIEMECGRLVLKEDREDKGLVSVIEPGYSEMIQFERRPGISGVCGVVTYVLEVPPSEEAEFLQVMFSVPYNLNTYDPYFAIGLSDVYLNVSGLFNEFYYYTGAFRRAEAGKLIEFTSQRIKVRGNMEPDSYKPILSLSILPLDPEDRFVPGAYVSLRQRNNQAGLSFGICLLLVSFLSHVILQ